MNGTDEVQELKQRLARLQGTELVPAAAELVTVAPQPLAVVAAPVAPGLGLARVALIASGLALGAVGLAINAEFARSLGATEWAGWLFLAVGVTSDVAAFALPTLATSLWRQHRLATGAAWGLWAVTFGFALIASVGFASLNIADTAIERAGRSSPAIEDARLALGDAKLIRDWECRRGVGPVCRQRQDEVLARQNRLDAERRAVVAQRDPQADGAGRLLRWLTLGWLDVDFGMLRLALLTLLPQMGGLLLAVARR